MTIKKNDKYIIIHEDLAYFFYGLALIIVIFNIFASISILSTYNENIVIYNNTICNQTVNYDNSCEYQVLEKEFEMYRLCKEGVIK